MRTVLMNYVHPDDATAYYTLSPEEQQADVDRHVEAKELLGGFVILETETLDEAVAIASDWPSLTSQAQATVQLHPVFVRE
jgi:hypothetical protein